MSDGDGGLDDLVADERHIALAWEPDIVSSWYRCREQYRVDPSLAVAPVAPARTERSSLYDVVFAELGGSAVSVLQEVENINSVITVADGTGRILAAWGDRATLNRARESNLAPLSYWAEGASGTNGIGTALEASGPVRIRGAEHWCQGFHNWVCAGIAVRDAVTDEPAAVLNICSWQANLPAVVTTWLSDGVATARAQPPPVGGGGGRGAGGGLRADPAAAARWARRDGLRRQGGDRRRTGRPVPGCPGRPPGWTPARDRTSVWSGWPGWWASTVGVIPLGPAAVRSTRT